LLSALSLLLFLPGWDFLTDWFDSGPKPPSADVVAEHIGTVLAEPGVRLDGHPDVPSLYASRGHALLWTTAEARAALRDALAEAPLDGVRASDVSLPEIDRALARLDEAAADWNEKSADAREQDPDLRPEALARLDVLLTHGALRYGEALLGRRVDPAQIHRGTWFPARRDTLGDGWEALRTAVARGDAARTSRALTSFRPRHAGYRRLRARLAALQDATLGPVPDGAPLAPGERSVRVPHLRARLSALGFLGADTLGAAWERADPYLFTTSIAAGLARFEDAHALEADSVLDDSSVAHLNADLDDLRATLAINLERWRWLPDDLGRHFIWVNLPAYDLRIYERDSTGYAERLQMPVNIGNAQTIGWTTPVITDSVHTVEFQPAWYVPASLVASNILPMARADSLALHRQGFEVTQNGRPVDSRLVKWDSVSTAGFRFVQRPGPANPLGRVKFLMTNPYAILIHDTNRRSTFADGRGGTLSSGCIHAGAPDTLAEYLLTNLNSWEAGEATAAYRGGPRRGVRLDDTMLSHFVYFTAWVDDDGALRLTDDPYGYDAKLREALASSARRDAARPAS
jgi:murein L,D-transpeptidase YcbB/YkuD